MKIYLMIYLVLISLSHRMPPVPPAPAPVKAMQSGLSSVWVTWAPPSPPGGEIRAYRLYWAAPGNAPGGGAAPGDAPGGGGAPNMTELPPHVSSFVLRHVQRQGIVVSPLEEHSEEINNRHFTLGY